jgi:hypothetical protein
MTNLDIQFFECCLAAGVLQSPFLEVGSAKVHGNLPNLADLARQSGLGGTCGVDMQATEGVDVVFDFSLEPFDFEARWQHGKFRSVALFNILEHTFDPFTVLRNALFCLEPGGSLLVSTPAIWPLHNCPGDYVRLMPNWYEQFAVSTRIDIDRKLFVWLSSFGMENIEPLPGGYAFPTFLNSGGVSKRRQLKSRVVHRIFNTYGRNHWATHVSIGVVYRKPAR